MTTDTVTAGTAPVMAAMAEIIRVGGWSLRALGYPFGVAERAIKMLAWAEAVHGQSVRALRGAEDRITLTAGLLPLLRARDGKGSWRLDGRGKHLLEVGSPAVDLLTSDGRLHGAGHISLTSTIGHGLVAALADLAARRDLACVAVYSSAQGDVLPDDVARAGWIVAAPAPGGPVFAVSALGLEADSVPEAIRLALPELTGEQVQRMRHDGAQAHGSESFIGLSAFRPDAAMAARLEAAGLAGRLTLANYSRRLAEGYRSGVAMETADLRYLYALERRTWAPTSERSRSQAGYGRF